MVYHLNVRFKVPFMQAVVEHFAGEANISLEGDLSACAAALADIPEVSEHEYPPLTRNTREPLLDFAIVPLRTDLLPQIRDASLPRIGLARRIIHILIEQNGVIVFAAIDGFDVESTWISEQFPVARLEELQEQRILKGYSRSKSTS